MHCIKESRPSESERFDFESCVMLTDHGTYLSLTLCHWHYKKSRAPDTASGSSIQDRSQDELWMNLNLPENQRRVISKHDSMCSVNLLSSLSYKPRLDPTPMAYFHRIHHSVAVRSTPGSVIKSLIRRVLGLICLDIAVTWTQ